MQECAFNQNPIGIFDSGVGGLSIVKEIRKKIPNESIVYFGDTARVPYGTKSKETITRFAKEDIGFLRSHKVKIIVSACFSVSSNALPELREEFDIPIIDMISPGIEALRDKSYRKIGVIGTNATIESGAFEHELKRNFKNIKIYSTPCPLFVPLAEEGWTNGKVPQLIAEKYLSPLIQKGIESLILGCTHYPLLYSVIRKVVGDEIDIIQPGKEVATLIKKSLQDRGQDSENKGSLQIFLSDIPRGFKRIATQFLGQNPGQIRLAKLSN